MKIAVSTTWLKLLKFTDDESVLKHCHEHLGN